MKLILLIFVGIQILHYVTTINSYILFLSQLINDKVNPVNEYGSNKSFNRTKKSVVVRETRRLWNNGIIPYEFKNVFTGPQRRLILQAMRHWEESTCIKFVKRDRIEYSSYILFSKLNCGCCADIGKIENSVSFVSIDDECTRFGTILHELGHAIGFEHEHLHPNRDDYVRIDFDNVMNGQKYSFDKLTAEKVKTLGQPYDYGSIMHYHSSSDPSSLHKQTIFPLRKINGKIPEIGQRIKLSEGDIVAANLLYNCSKCSKTFSKPTATFSPPTNTNNSLITSIDCEWTIRAAEGERIRFNIIPLNNNNISNTIHNFLEIKNGYQPNAPVFGVNHTDATFSFIGDNYVTLKYSNPIHNDLPYGFLVDYETICQNDIYIACNDIYYLESPNYPKPYEAHKECQWHISVPENYGVKINFYDFELGNSTDCVNDFLEIRYGNFSNALLTENHCGKADNFTIVSATQNVLLNFVSKEYNNGMGFSAAISAIPFS